MKEVYDIMERLSEMNSKDGTVFLFVIGTPMNSGYQFTMSTNGQPPLLVFMSEFAKMHIMHDFIKIEKDLEQDEVPYLGNVQ